MRAYRKPRTCRHVSASWSCKFPSRPCSANNETAFCSLYPRLYTGSLHDRPLPFVLSPLLASVACACYLLVTPICRHITFVGTFIASAAGAVLKKEIAQSGRGSKSACKLPKSLVAILALYPASVTMTLLHVPSVFVTLFAALSHRCPLLNRVLNRLADSLGIILSGDNLIEGTLSALQGDIEQTYEASRSNEQARLT